MKLHLRATGCHCHMGSHSVTCHPTSVHTPCLNPSQTGRYLIYPYQRHGCRWTVGYILRWFTGATCLVTHPSTNPAVHSRESNLRPVDHTSNTLTTTLPSHLHWELMWCDVVCWQLDMIVGLLGTPSAEDLRTVCEAARVHMRRKSSRPSNLLSLYRLSRDSDHDVVSLLSSIFVYNPVSSSLCLRHL